MNGLDLLGIVIVLVAAFYGAHRLDRWEDERELEWRVEDTMRRARESLDRIEDEFPSVIVFDQDKAA